MSVNSAKLRRTVQDIRASLWFLPTVAVLGAIALASGLSRVSLPRGSWVAELVFAGGAEGARGMLQAVAGSVITVTSLVFSLTVVTLQLASSQFSPRLLRTFLSDRGNQVVLAMFLATFAYSLTVLRFIRDGGNGEATFVPQLAVSVAFLLVLGSVAALVYFIHHISQEIQVDTMMRDVVRETRRTIEHVYANEVGQLAADRQAPDVPETAACLITKRSGFLQDVDLEQLTSVAREHDVVIRLDSAIGQAVAEHTPLAWVWRRDGSRPPPDTLQAVHPAVDDAVELGHERTPQRDVALGLRQLVDVAVKAMSPAINDPTTAVHAIGHLTSLLCVLAGRELGDLVGADDDGVERVGVERPGFEGYLDLACGQIRRFGAGETHVTKALLWLLREVAGASPPQRHDIVRVQAGLVAAAAEKALSQEYDRDRVRRSAAAVERALAGDQRPIA